MSQAESLLYALANDTDTTYPDGSTGDEYIVIGKDRAIIVPDALKRIAVQYDHNIETVTFDCPRYWDEHDMSTMVVYINYRLPDKSLGSYIAKNVRVNSDDPSRMLFDWTIEGNVTQNSGSLAILVCVKKTDANGNETNHWNSELNTEMYISEGLEGIYDPNGTEYADLLTQLLLKMDTASAEIAAETTTQIEAIQSETNAQKEAISAHGEVVLASLPEDYTATYNMAEEALRKKANAIALDAEGEAIFVEDSADAHLLGLNLYGKTTQGDNPTPDNPQELVSIVNPTVKICGANIFDVDAFVNNASNNGVLTAIQKAENGVQVMVTSYLEKLTKYDFGFKPDTQYTVSFEADWDNATNDTAQVSMLFYYTDGTYTSVPINYIDGAKTYTMVSESGKTVASIAIGTWRYAGLCILRNINLVEGSYNSSAMPAYEACIPQTLTLANTLSGIPVDADGNYTDSDGQEWICDEIDLERGVYIQRVYEKVFDGTEGWRASQYQTDENNIRYDYTASAYPAQGASNCLSAYYPYNGVSKRGMWVNSDQTKYAEFRIQWSYETVEELTAFLAAQHEAGTPVTCKYILLTPIETPLTEEEIANYKQLKTNFPNTTVLNDGGAHVKLTYNADTKTYQDNSLKVTEEQLRATVEDYVEQASQYAEECKAEVVLVAETFITGKYIYGSTGTETTFSAYSASEYIDVSRYQGMACVIHCYMRDFAGFAFYDANEVYISGVHGSAAGSADPWWMDYAAEIPNNACYIRYTVGQADNDNGSVTVKIDAQYLMDKIDQLSADTDVLRQQMDEAGVNLSAQSFTTGKYIYGSDGREVTFSAWSASEYLDISAYRGMDCVIHCYMQDYAGFAFYNESQVYISGANGFGAESVSPWWVDYSTQIPENASYIRYTVRPADNDNGSVTINPTVGCLAKKVAELEKNGVAKQVPYAYALTKILCIGDSLTNGAYYTSGRTDLQVGITQDYPQVLSRMLNAEVTNAGVNGAKASTWWKNRVENYDFTQYDSFIIWLGTNAGFTDTLDTDVTAYESYEDFAETETGYLCKIIQKILTDNPDAFIAIGTIFASNDDVEVSNTLIGKVAEKYGLTVIDFSDLTTSNYPKLHNEISNCHFNKAGNIFIASRIMNTINEVLNADPMRCEFGMTAQ